MQGRRLKDCKPGELPCSYDEIQPGDYWKHLNDEGDALDCGDEYFAGGNLTRTVWSICVPGGNGIGRLRRHTVHEHDDGTISVRPGDGSSNSILQGSWHGYIEHGVWSTC